MSTTSRKWKRFTNLILIIVLLLTATLLLSGCDLLNCNTCNGTGRVRSSVGGITGLAMELQGGLSCPSCGGSGNASIRVGNYSIPVWYVFVMLGLIGGAIAISEYEKSKKEKKADTQAAKQEELLRRQNELLEEQNRFQREQPSNSKRWSCNICKTQNSSDGRFCSNCGSAKQ